MASKIDGNSWSKKIKRRIFLISIFFASCLIVIFLPLVNLPIASTVAQDTTQIEQLEQESFEFYQAGDYSQAKSSLEQLIELLESNPSSGQEQLAIAYTNLGRLHYYWNHSQAALSAWGKSAELYRQIGKTDSVKQLQIYQAQAWQKLGHWTKACNLLINSG